MGKHTGILDVSNTIMETLRINLSPEIIQSADTIGLCSPDERGDFVLGIHLYDIRESEEYRNNDMINVSFNKQKYPSTFLTLSYMITAYSKADVKFKEGEDQRILGKVVQTLADNPVVKAESLGGSETDGNMDTRIKMISLSPEEKQKLWNIPNVPYRTTLFYKVSPVEIESAKTRSVQRVLEADFKTVEKNQNMPAE